MIIVYHNENRIVAVSNNANLNKANGLSIANFLVQLAKENKGEILAWCHIDLKDEFNTAEIAKIFHHKKLMLSYNPTNCSFLGKSIGYIDDSHFAQINKKVAFSTWQMSSAVGCIHSEVLLALQGTIPFGKNFDYCLNSLAKLSIAKGLFCYSEPKLLKQSIVPKNYHLKSDYYTLFRFVKQHFKIQWICLLLLNLFLYERKFPVLPLLFSLFYKNRSKLTVNLDSIKVMSSKKVIDKSTIDIIIPTIGRKNYLYDVLKDFSKQTLLPQKIIIVEQNPELGSTTELDYLTIEKWPFEIQHIFTHQAGACNARNLALKETKSEWVFLADDDNRFEADLLAEIFSKIAQFGNVVVTTSYPQKKEVPQQNTVIQWRAFGAGNSIVRRDILTNVKFNKAFEFGYGEDGDFGMQLRNLGFDVLYLPEPVILHLKAPIGGFRTKPVLQWHKDDIQPKPSPTLMLHNILHNTKEQINSYKTALFFNYYKLQKIKNPIKYYIHFQKQWERSIFWANELRNQNEI